MAGIVDEPADRQHRVPIGRISIDTFAGTAPQSAVTFILTHLTAATLVTLTHHLLAARHRSRQST